MLDFGFASEKEIRVELGKRLRARRLAQGVSQAELAQRAAASVSSLKLLESKGRCNFETFIRVTLALGLTHEMQSLFELRIRSIAEMERAESPKRSRAPRRRAGARLDNERKPGAKYSSDAGKDE
jgi:transcriptional regulator with XRE-family HTH domain